MLPDLRILFVRSFFERCRWSAPAAPRMPYASAAPKDPHGACLGVIGPYSRAMDDGNFTTSRMAGVLGCWSCHCPIAAHSPRPRVHPPLPWERSRAGCEPRPEGPQERNEAQHGDQILRRGQAPIRMAIHHDRRAASSWWRPARRGGAQRVSGDLGASSWARQSKGEVRGRPRDPGRARVVGRRREPDRFPDVVIKAWSMWMRPASRSCSIPAMRPSL